MMKVPESVKTGISCSNKFSVGSSCSTFKGAFSSRKKNSQKSDIWQKNWEDLRKKWKNTVAPT